MPSDLTNIGNFAFGYCSSLTSITIPSGVTSIGANVFGYCSGLTAINVDADNSNYCSADGVLFSKDKTKLVGFPEGKNIAYSIPSSVTSIGDDAFERCSLTSITIPSGVTSIGNYAFERGNLTSITIPSGVTTIGNNAFWFSKGLTSVKILSSVTSIGDYAFGSCSSLASITIPSGITNIGSYAFGSCTNLTIYGYSGSYAQTYASQNGIAFTAISLLPLNISNLSTQKNSGNVSVTAQITNNAPVSETVTVVYAVYNSSTNRLLGTSSGQITLASGAVQSYGSTIAIAKNVSNYTVKVMVFDSLSKLTPLAKSVTYTSGT
jgi:hypothetical protein